MSNAGTTTHPFLAFASDDKDIEALKAFVAAKGWADNCIIRGNINDAAVYLKNNKTPPLLLVEITSAAEASKQLDALAEVCDPNSKVIIIGSVNEYSFFCWLMDLGISSYLLRPLTEEALKSAVDKAEAPAVAVAPGSKKPGKVIAVVGARGGVGATTLSVNLAGIIAEKSKKQVALVDLDARQGTIALALDLEPSRGFREALEKPDRIDSLFLDRVMSKPTKHLSILSSEESIQEQLKIHEGAAKALIQQLKEVYDIIVLDVPRTFDPFSTQCLGMSEHVLLAVELSLLSLRDALRVQDLMREALKIKPPTVVAMRTGMVPKHQVVQADFEKGIDNKISYIVPYAPDVFMPIDMNVPALKAKGHAATKPLMKLAADLVPEAAIDEKSEKSGKKSGGLLAKKKA